MTNLPKNVTTLSASASFDFKIDDIHVLGPAQNRLRQQFGSELRGSPDRPRQLEADAIHISLASDIGTRPRNEDSAVAMLAHVEAGNTVLPIAVVAVADGIGGAADGDLASAIAIQTLTESIVGKMAPSEDFRPNKLLRESSINAMLTDSVQAAHSMIKAETHEGGCTLTCILIVNHTAYLAHVGDSRAYLLNTRHRDIELVTPDQRLVREWEKAGILTPEQAEHHPLGHVLYQWLGKSELPEILITHRGLAAGSCLLLCTDGVSDVLSQSEIYNILIDHVDQPDQACKRLLTAAAAHNTHDDATAVLVEIRG